MRPRILAFLVLACVTVSAQQGFDEVKAKAVAGDPKSQNELGVMYRQGDGVGRDKAKAVEWYRKAAFQKYPDALYNLGIAYFNGDGVASDELRAYAYLSIAQDEGSSEASAALNQFTQDWRESKVNHAKALKADIYNHGIDVPENPERAFKIYLVLAEEGDSFAQYTTCLLLDGGRGVKKDSAEAFQWCLKAAKQGEPLAMFAVGNKYEHGIGTAVDYKEAEHWYRFVGSFTPEADIRIAHLYKSGSLKSKEPLWADAYLSYAAYDKAAQAELESDVAQMDDKKKRKLEELKKKVTDELYRMKFKKP